MKICGLLFVVTRRTIRGAIEETPNIANVFSYYCHFLPLDLKEKLVKKKIKK